MGTFHEGRQRVGGVVSQRLVSPHVLWRKASAEYPDDRTACRDRYIELMREHGHIVKAEPGQDRNLPCGWPGRRPDVSDIEDGSEFDAPVCI
jgi:hypothetical protein